jgi:hypothetical protein
MLQCTDELNACLKSANEELKAYIEAELEQLAQNKNALERRTKWHRRCVKELREQKQAVSLQQSRVDAMRQATLETKAGVERDEAARQDAREPPRCVHGQVQGRHVAAGQDRGGNQRARAYVLYIRGEPSGALSELAQLARRTKSLQVDCSKEFNKKKCFLEGTSSKLAAEALDLHARQDVLDIQLQLTERVMERF